MIIIIKVKNKALNEEYSPARKLILLEIEVSEKIDNKNLKNFIFTNFKLKNITTNKNDKTFLIYIKELKKYQIFILNRKV